MADATYDITFKDLFGKSGTSVHGITPEDRLISLLNSIYYPNIPDSGVKIRLIEYISPYVENSITKSMIFDIACNCFCSHSSTMTKDNATFVFDVEIQRA
jgi:hypothetical protein